MGFHGEVVVEARKLCRDTNGCYGGTCVLEVCNGSDVLEWNVLRRHVWAHGHVIFADGLVGVNKDVDCLAGGDHELIDGEWFCVLSVRLDNCHLVIGD